MTNELLIILSFFLIYGGVILFYYFFGKKGLLAFNILSTILANIEVLILVNAYGMEMTLGNVLFASTFLITDIFSENHSRKDANKAVIISSLCSLFFVLISQTWLLYTPSENDLVSDSIRTIFSSTPRIVCASLGVYLISQLTDVWLYHKWWEWCKKHFKNSQKGLWIRNNGSTMISQFINTLLYTLFAFYGTYSNEILLSIFGSTYLIYFILSIIDTPFVYLARKIHIATEKKNTEPQE